MVGILLANARWFHVDPRVLGKRICLSNAVDHLCRATQTRPAVRATRLPHNPVLVAKKHRPKGYWKHKYIEKQETHPGKVAVRLD